MRRQQQRSTRVAPSQVFRIRLIALLLAGVVVVPLGLAGTGGRIISAHGVRFVAPSGWQRVPAANAGAVTDPRTLLVAGTAGVRPRTSQCLIAAYRLPPVGAAVVVVRWNSVASAGGGPLPPGRAPLRKLRSVHRPSFECFSGRGAVAVVLLGGRPYQVNVMVGDRASQQRVAEALAVARSFDLTHECGVWPIALASVSP
jgi:hypothetical protein